MKKKDETKKKGRPYNYGEPVKSYRIAVNIPENMMANLLRKMGTGKKGEAVRKLIEEKVNS